MHWQRVLAAVFVVVIVTLVAAHLAGVRYRVMGHYEGVFALREGKGLLVTDDIMLGEEPRILWVLPIEPLKELLESNRHLPGQAYVDFEWFRHDGSGFVRNVFPDGRKIRTCFSRFIADDGGVVKGLIVGGGLPFMEGKRLGNNHDDTGMAYYDGTKWHHLWCNANEIIILGERQDHKVDTHMWEFVGSRVMEADDAHVLIRSSHKVRHETTLLNIDRYALFQAGKPYFILIQKVRNGGDVPARYSWVYADEPWVGNYGSSSGNVGWSAGKLHYYEGRVDTGSSSFAGMADLGNPAAGESPGSYSGLGSFIEWLGARRPTFAYFANQIGRFAEGGQKVPLANQSSRCIALEWWPEPILPGAEHVYILAIGMAEKGDDGKPVKPNVEIERELLERILSVHN